MKSWVGIALILCTASATAFAYDDQDLIDYRQHIMATLGEQLTLLDMMVQKKAPATDFATQAQALAVTAATAKQAFEAKVSGGNAKPTVWQNWADFSKHMDEMTAATTDLAKLAKQGGIAAAGPKVGALNCKGCHDTYMSGKK